MVRRMQSIMYADTNACPSFKEVDSTVELQASGSNT